jgi:hypothetical protein
MNYFQYQDVVPYTFGDVTVDLTNITERAKIAERLGQYTSAMYDYVIEEEQRPDTVALLVYGDVKYTWLVLLLNNIVSLYDWPLSTTEFADYIVSKYGSISAAKAGTPIYYTTEGDRVDAVTYATLPSARRGTVRTPYEQEEVDNEAKRRIRVVSSRFLSSIEQTLKTLYR